MYMPSTVNREAASQAASNRSYSQNPNRTDGKEVVHVLAIQSHKVNEQDIDEMWHISALGS